MNPPRVLDIDDDEAHAEALSDGFEIDGADGNPILVDQLVPEPVR